MIKCHNLNVQTGTGTIYSDIVSDYTDQMEI